MFSSFTSTSSLVSSYDHDYDEMMGKEFSGWEMGDRSGCFFSLDAGLLQRDVISCFHPRKVELLPLWLVEDW